LTPKSRKEILELLVVGLKRLEYRGYDSAGKFLFSFRSFAVKSFIYSQLFCRARIRQILNNIMVVISRIYDIIKIEACYRKEK